MATYGEYMEYSYGIPVAFFVALLVHLTILSNYRASNFIVDIVLGIRRIPEKTSNIPSTSSTTNQQQSEEINNTKATCCTRSMSKIECCCNIFENVFNDYHEYVSTYLHIERAEKLKFNRYRRLYSCMSTSYILTILLTFIYESCILSNATIKIGDWCPDHDAECFDVKSQMLVFNCTPNQKITFTTNSNYVACFGWIYHQMTFRKVLDAVGVAGGLLGIISCIVPWTYYLSYYENTPCKAFLWVWVPFIPLVALIAISAVSDALKLAPPSILTIYSLGFSFSLISFGWVFAFFTARKRKRKVSPKTDADQPTTPPPTIIQIPD